MEFRRFKAQHKGIILEIEEDRPEVGAYLYVFMPSGEQRDELEISALSCMERALENFEVPSVHGFKLNLFLYRLCPCSSAKLSRYFASEVFNI